MSKAKGFYAVHKGRAPNIYKSWTECEQQVKGFKGAIYKKFDNEDEAKTFVLFGHLDADCDSDEAHDEEVSTVYTEGSCLKNGVGDAKGGIGVYWRPRDPRNTSTQFSGPQTNQRAAAIAVIHALKQDQNSTLEIRTNSLYVINAVTLWSREWQKNNWIASNNKPVVNRDLIEEILDLVAARNEKVIFTHVSRKENEEDEGLEEACRLAKRAANGL